MKYDNITFFSATITNLKKGRILFFSASLTLFWLGWVKNDQPFEYGPIPPDYGKGRMLVKIGDTKIVVSAMVVVNQDGTGNFTTIGEAVVAGLQHQRIPSQILVILGYT